MQPFEHRQYAVELFGFGHRRGVGAGAWVCASGVIFDSTKIPAASPRVPRAMTATMIARGRRAGAAGSPCGSVGRSALLSTGGGMADRRPAGIERSVNITPPPGCAR